MVYKDKVYSYYHYPPSFHLNPQLSPARKWNKSPVW